MTLNYGILIRFVSLLVLLVLNSFVCQAQTNTNEPSVMERVEIKKPLYKPFIERYILDELKQLRQDQQSLKAELIEKVAYARLDVSDRAIRYTADTTNNIFYLITATVSILVLLGWKSLKDIKDNIELISAKKVDELTLEYEKRLSALETTLKERSDQIVANQEEISSGNLIHSLWMRAGLEKSEEETLRIYDQILEIKNNDVEALTYKADLLLDMGEDSWALSLVNQALEEDSDYALAYWQRACAKVKLNQLDGAVEDIKMALELSNSLKDELLGETFFEGLKENPDFQSLLDEIKVTS